MIPIFIFHHIHGFKIYYNFLLGNVLIMLTLYFSQTKITIYTGNYLLFLRGGGIGGKSKIFSGNGVKRYKKGLIE